VVVEVPAEALAELVMTGRNMSDHVPDNYLEALRSATSHVPVDRAPPPHLVMSDFAATDLNSKATWFRIQ
jgi:hypothetical protein